METKYRTEETDGVVTIWNDTEGIGLRFNEGETLSGYTAALVISDPSLTSTDEGLRKLDKVSNELRAQAEKDYPKEFAPLKD